MSRTSLTNLFVSEKCINDIVCEATGILESLNVWFRLNQLTLNLSKTLKLTEARLCNKLPVDIKNSKSLKMFKYKTRKCIIGIE